MLAVARLAVSNNVKAYPAHRITGGNHQPAIRCLGRPRGTPDAGSVQLARLHNNNGIKNTQSALVVARDVSPPHQYPSSGHRTVCLLDPHRRTNCAVASPPTCTVSD